MVRSANKLDVYVEAGQKRVFAGAIDWPGWCRSARNEEAAMLALLEYAPRYARALRSSRLEFGSPATVASFNLVERLHGNMTTDFGAPGLPPAADARDLDEKEMKRLQAILKGCWRTLDAATKAAAGRTLRSGPRGGGRGAADIVRHVVDAERGYLGALGWKFKPADDAPEAKLQSTREAILAGLTASANGEIPARGPRGGMRWTARYFVRRDAWHVLDHAWEIEDRLG
jgi:hypothetical protein